MKKLAVETYNMPSGVTTLHWRLPTLAAVALAIVAFIPSLIILNPIKLSSTKHWDDYDAGWKDWHAKYDRYVTRDRKHKLNSVSPPSEWPDAGVNAECICRFTIINAPDDATLFTAFQAHLDDNEPKVLNLADLGQPGAASVAPRTV